MLSVQCCVMLSTFPKGIRSFVTTQSVTRPNIVYNNNINPISILHIKWRQSTKLFTTHNTQLDTQLDQRLKRQNTDLENTFGENYTTCRHDV